MDISKIDLIIDHIKRSTGASMRGSKNLIESRSGLSFWFENYNRSNGAIFSIRPTGLKRHKVSMGFGAYAAPCIEHIQRRATSDDYTLAYAFTEQLSNLFDLRINDKKSVTDWKVLSSLKISVIRKVSNQHSLEEISESITLMMIPLVAAMAELIGYDHDQEGNSEVEGNIYQSISKRRERNPRNRLLCLSIHGEKCGVCGFTTRNIYGDTFPSILEVHHIEPLAEIDHPKAYDPRTDLIPLCPNCHKAIHKKNPAFTPKELKKMMTL
jgi:5-methylcytosine-specific restriction enzyme A